MNWDWMEEIIQNRETKPQDLIESLERLKDFSEPRARAYESEVNFWLADVSASSDKLALYEKAVESAKMGLKAPTSEGSLYFWLGTNLGLLGQERGILPSLFLLPEIESNLRKSLELEETYFFAAPHRALGWLFHKIPPWPISSGNSKKGYDHLLHAIELGDGFPLNHLYAGEVAYSIGKRNEGKKHVTRVIEWPRDGIHDREFGLMKIKALELLKKYE